MPRPRLLPLFLSCLLGATLAVSASGRSFHLAFTPLPPDITEAALDWTYQAIGEHADLIAHHLDDGVPWPEALARSTYPPPVENEIRQRRERTPGRVRTYLAVTPISILRDGLAPYWGPNGPEALPDPWDGRGLGHPQVIRAFLRYSTRMIEELEPDYFAYGIEVDLLARNNPEEFPGFRKLARKVYKRLKRKYPDLPIFFTFTLGNPGDWEKIQRDLRPLLPYTDYLAVSTYPFLIPSFGGDPDNVPVDWFTRIRDLDASKPIAVAETGFAAERVVIDSLQFDVPGRRSWQKRYLRRLLTEMADLDAEFIVWFVLGDYDRLWDLLEQAGAPEWSKAWRDTGLFDEEQRPRPALRIWKRSLRRTID